MERPDLHRITQQALRTRALDNRGRLAPPQLSRLGITLADLLLDGNADLAESAHTFVEQGLALTSVMAAATALQSALVTTGEISQALHVADRLADLAVAIDNANIVIVLQDQEKIHAAVTRALNEQRVEIERQHAEIEQQRMNAQRLVSLVHELSTPIVPVYKGILVLPLIGSLDSYRFNDVTERLLHEIAEHNADSIIIDITGVPLIDTGVAQHLLQTARAVKLLGTTVILTGIGPDIAQTIVQLGIELQGIVTLRDLEAGITYALRRRKLVIRSLEPV